MRSVLLATQSNMLSTGGSVTKSRKHKLPASVCYVCFSFAIWLLTSLLSLHWNATPVWPCDSSLPRWPHQVVYPIQTQRWPRLSYSTCTATHTVASLSSCVACNYEPAVSALLSCQPWCQSVVVCDWLTSECVLCMWEIPCGRLSLAVTQSVVVEMVNWSATSSPAVGHLRLFCHRSVNVCDMGASCASSDTQVAQNSSRHVCDKINILHFKV